jgi:hypothetical protein
MPLERRPTASKSKQEEKETRRKGETDEMRAKEKNKEKDDKGLTSNLLEGRGAIFGTVWYPKQPKHI